MGAHVQWPKYLISSRLWAGSRIGDVDGRIVFQNELGPLSFCDLFEIAGSGTADWHSQLVEGSGESGRSNRIWDVVWKGTNSGDGVLELSVGRPNDLEQWMALVKIACKVHATMYRPS